MTELNTGLLQGLACFLIIPNWRKHIHYSTQGVGWVVLVYRVTSKHARNGASSKNSVPIRAFLRGWSTGHSTSVAPSDDEKPNREILGMLLLKGC